MGYRIKEYENKYEKSWLRCRVLSFLDSAFYDDVNIKKEVYKNPSIALIALNQDKVIGFIDIEYELIPTIVCSKSNKLEEHLSGMIWHLGIHPDFRKQGIAKRLLTEAIVLAKQKNLKRLEAWTRDDKIANYWYIKNEFELTDEYIHWYYDSRYDDFTLLKNILKVEGNMNQVLQTFGHSKIMTEEINKLNRKYFCRRFDKLI